MHLEKNIFIRPFTTYQVGGPADLFVFAKTRHDLQHAVAYALEKNIPYFILGLGANILVSDQGFRGLVIRNLYNPISISTHQTTTNSSLHFLRAGSGATIERAIHVARNSDLSGLEHFAGIPSTVGGALWQNLHFLNSERNDTVFIAEMVHHAYVFNMISGQENFLMKEDFKFGYDTSILHQGNHIVLDAVFSLQKTNFYDIGIQMRENLKWRSQRHPPLTEQPSCGSVFKRTDGGVGRIIEKLGLKGFSIGGAMVSIKHANFIVNMGNASAQDIFQVISHVQKVVLEETGYQLEREIRLVGEF